MLHAGSCRCRAAEPARRRRWLRTLSSTHSSLRKPELNVSTIAAFAPGTAVHAKGKQRVNDIVHTATRVLAFEGYSNFTMRGIAAKAGIALKNLQYYFPTKDSLF